MAHYLYDRKVVNQCHCHTPAAASRTTLHPSAETYLFKLILFPDENEILEKSCQSKVVCRRLQHLFQLLQIFGHATFLTRLSWASRCGSRLWISYCRLLVQWCLLCEAIGKLAHSMVLCSGVLAAIFWHNTLFLFRFFDCVAFVFLILKGLF